MEKIGLEKKQAKTEEELRERKKELEKCQEKVQELEKSEGDTTKELQETQKRQKELTIHIKGLERLSKTTELQIRAYKNRIDRLQHSQQPQTVNTSKERCTFLFHFRLATTFSTFTKLFSAQNIRGSLYHTRKLIFHISASARY